MAARKAKEKRVEELLLENARLRGESLATGVLLAQLLQSIAKTQLNPQAFADRIIKQAHDAVEDFKPEEPRENDLADAMREAALETVQHYDTQIRSVLPV